MFRTYYLTPNFMGYVAYSLEFMPGLSVGREYVRCLLFAVKLSKC